ncbi:LSU m3Psi1915 methyltransferase RlmH [hydrothermal vent metagenome]|uniref:LSU m3Psi1915 methyltransferase RlmH n=1 Tax=hydrothermal vent metagenome TaxID=652676 RepID=A0A1W1BPT8_9ZZZZ
MKLKLIAIGNKLPAWIEEGIQDYQKRLPKNIHFQLLTPNAKKRTKNTSTKKNIDIESEILLETSQGSSKIIALDERGKHRTTKQFADKIKDWQQNDEKVSFLIGGADGHNNKLKQTADEIWSISDFTLPHGIARLVMVEQIYRAISLLNNHPYHRE